MEMSKGMLARDRGLRFDRFCWLWRLQLWDWTDWAWVFDWISIDYPVEETFAFASPVGTKACSRPVSPAPSPEGMDTDRSASLFARLRSLSWLLYLIIDTRTEEAHSCLAVTIHALLVDQASISRRHWKATGNRVHTTREA